MMCSIFIGWAYGILTVIFSFSLSIGGDSEYLKMPGILQTDRYGGQVIEEIEKDYLTNLGGVCNEKRR